MNDMQAKAVWDADSKHVEKLEAKLKRIRKQVEKLRDGVVTDGLQAKAYQEVLDLIKGEGTC